MSGCDKLLSHGRPVNAVAKDTGSEATPSLTSNASALLPSNTPAPTPEPQPLSDSAVSSSRLSWHWWFPMINVSNSVAYWALNSVGYVVALALAIVVGYDVFRYFKPIKVITPKPEPAGDITLTLDQIQNEGFKYCYIRDRSIISYTWYLAKRKVKRYFWADVEDKEIDSKIFVYQLHNDYYGSDNVYVYQSNPANPAPN
jgi:hypothetical protein